VKTEVWQCDLCAHQWIIGDKEPTHCPKCRSRKWNKVTSYRATEIVVSDTGHWVETMKPAPADDLEPQSISGVELAERSVEYEVEA
jgi:hypothetical protein